MLAPTGAVTVIEPVVIVQLGCVVIDAVGVAGAAGIALIVKGNGADIQPVELSFAVTE